MLLKFIGRNPNASMRYFAVLLIIILCYDTCKGQDETPSEFGPRVSGGADAPKGRFPYMCSIRKRGGGRHICGGTLINNQWLMTAAHCLDPADPESAGMSPFLYCGIYGRNEQDISKRFIPSRCYLHHLWDGKVRNSNDIALCQLRTTANIAFPDLSNIGDDYTKNDVFTVLGWGRTTSRGSLADILQIGEGLRYVLPSTCNEVPAWAGNIKTSMLCAGFALPNTCRGDSGGPLLIRHDPFIPNIREDPVLDLIVGITSFGLTDCEADAPGVYTRVSCYRPWINCVMEGKGEECSSHVPCSEGSSLCSGIQKSATFDETNALTRISRTIISDVSETVKQLLCDGLSPNAIYDRFNNSLLHRAAQYDAIESAKVLLEHGSQIEYKNSYGQAALSRAARYGSFAVTKLLIENGADIETKSDRGWTPLTNAARYNQVEVAKFLIQNEANIESKTNEGSSPLYLAAEENFLDVAKLLLQNGANIESKQKTGFTPLSIAAQKNSVGVAEILLENGADIEAKENFGFTPLLVAAQNDSIDVAKILLENGADMEAKEDLGFTPLHITAQWNSLGVAKELISNGATIESETNNGASPLHIAAYHGSLSALHLLLDENAIIDATNNGGVTPLHYAASRGHVSVVRSLLSNGASKTKTDDDGDTPFDVICTSGLLDEPCKADVIATLQKLLRV